VSDRAIGRVSRSKALIRREILGLNVFDRELPVRRIIKLVVNGFSGFIGSKFVKQRREHGQKVVLHRPLPASTLSLVAEALKIHWW
jgi:hypothetical protein